MNKYIFIYILLIFGLVSSDLSAEISVHLSRNKATLNESFSVTFTSTKKTRVQPDFSSLCQDFEIISNSQGMSTSIINGKVSEEKRWTLNLIAKHTGKLTIPSISFGDEKSLAETIEITASELPKPGEPIFLETELNPQGSVYERTPLNFTVRLYCSLQITGGSLSDLQSNDNNATIERIGPDTQHEMYHKNGKRYMVVERQYRVIPQHVGELVFFPIIFEGDVVTGGYSLFDLQTDYKRVYSNQEKIEVKPIPVQFEKNQWFAANDVSLTEKWSQNTNEVNLGEPLTLDLTIKALGAPADQIPDITFNFPKELKSYLDKPELSNEKTAAGDVGVKQIKMALIPSKAGEFNIPEIVIEWWNLKKDKKEETKLPGRTIYVKSEEVAMATPGMTANVIEDKLESVNEPELLKESLVEWQMFPIFAIGIVTAGLLISLIFIYAKVSLKKTDSLRQRKKELKNACLKNDAKLTESKLLAWILYLFPEIKPLNLMTIKPYLTDELHQEIDELYQFLYGQKGEWNGALLWKACSYFKPLKTNAKKKSKSYEMRNLYPD